MSPENSTPVTDFTDATLLRGNIGEDLAEVFEQHGIRTVGDLMDTAAKAASSPADTVALLAQVGVGRSTMGILLYTIWERSSQNSPEKRNARYLEISMMYGGDPGD